MTPFEACLPLQDLNKKQPSAAPSLSQLPTLPSHSRAEPPIPKAVMGQRDRVAVLRPFQ
jgi:hypothetical protein